MDNTINKTIKKTTYKQFQKLVALMDEYPHLATGSPVFGSSRAEILMTWDTVAEKVNAAGPPDRTGVEWKTVWADQKCRIKKKISENNRSLRETGGGPCRVNNLTELEQDVNRICNLSSAAEPSGNPIGYLKATKTMVSASKNNVQITPPGVDYRVADDTPTTSAHCRSKSHSNPQLQPTINCETTTPQRKLQTSTIITTQNSTSIQSEPIMLSESPPLITSTPKRKQQPTRPLQQRKIQCNNTKENDEQIELLRKQVKQQEEMIQAMQEQAKTSKNLAEALTDIADSTKIIAEAFIHIIDHFKNK